MATEIVRRARTGGKRAAMLAWAGLLAGCTGGADTVISGLGNSGNLVNAPAHQQLAKELADHDGAPAVSTEDLRRAFLAIRDKALDGELDAALVLFQVASFQRDAAD